MKARQVTAADLDGDDVTDLLISAPFEIVELVNGEINRQGAVFVHSGATGQLLRELNGPGGVIFGTSVTGTSVDLDLDNVSDIIIGAPSLSDPTNADMFHIIAISGMSGATLAETTFGELKGGDVAGQPLSADLNHDGLIDASDLSLLLHAFGTASSAEDGREADLNGDGAVDDVDLAAMLPHLGDRASSVSGRVPMLEFGDDCAVAGGAGAVVAGAVALCNIGCLLPIVYSNPYTAVGCFVCLEYGNSNTGICSSARRQLQ